MHLATTLAAVAGPACAPWDAYAQTGKDGTGDPGKSRGLVRTGDHSKLQRLYRFVSANQDTYPVGVMCRLLQVSTSGYYGWRNRPLSPRARRDVELAALVHTIHERSHRTYGARRVHAELCEAHGVRVGRKRVAR